MVELRRELAAEEQLSADVQETRVLETMDALEGHKQHRSFASDEQDVLVLETVDTLEVHKQHRSCASLGNCSMHCSTSCFLAVVRSRRTTAMDGGSAENAGAIFCPTSLWAPLR